MKKPAKKLSVAFLFDDTLDSTAGVAQYVKALGSWLASEGHHVCYLVGETNSQQWDGGRIYSLSKNLKIRFNGNQLSTPLPAISNSNIKKILATEKPDIVHVQVPYSPLMSQRVINRLDDKTAVIGTFHILPASWATQHGTKGLRYVYGSSLRRFDTMLAVSQAAASFASSTLKVSTKVVPNTIDLSRFRKAAQKKRQPKKPLRIIFLGRLVKRKGAKELLAAYHKVIEDGVVANLIVAGDGPELAVLKKYVDQHELSSSVSFPGFIDENKKANLLASADITCFPSLNGESFGISLIEAMAAGAGVVLAGDNPGYRTVLGDQPDSLVDPCNTDLFAQRLKQLLTDDSLRARIGDWQHHHVEQFDIDEVGQRILSEYRRAIDKRTADR